MKLPSTERKLTTKKAEFAALYAKSNDLVWSYREVFAVARKSEAFVQRAAKTLINDPMIQRAVADHKTSLGEKLLFEIKDVMAEWFDIATADPNELISVHNDSCRYCHGIGHQYQWRDEQEFSQAVARVMAENMADGTNYPLPTNEGGYGYRFSRDCNPGCPKCEGRGVPVVLMADTTKLKGKAKKLYAGVKQTKDGLQILMRDQDKALENYAKAMGMFAEVVRLEAFMKIASAEVKTNDPKEAAQLYETLMRGSK